MKLHRRALLGMTALSMASFSGCLSGLKHSAQDAGLWTKPTISHSAGTTTYEPVVEGQPTIEEGVLVVWGVTAANPAIARRLVDWGELTPEEGDDGLDMGFRSFEKESSVSQSWSVFSQRNLA